MSDISIVITYYNSPKYLKDCVDSIINSVRGLSIEIIVVDDASGDHSAKQLAEKYRQVRVIRNDSNLGYVRSNNIGIKASKGRYVLSLNNDTLIKNAALEKLAVFMESHPEAGAVGPKLLNSNGSVQYQCRRGFPTPSNSFFYFSGLSRLFPKNKAISGYLMTHLDDKSTVEVDSLCGAAMMVRREVIDSIGLMDEKYVMYGDDIDWCFRIKKAGLPAGKAGWRIYYHPDAEIVHYGGRGGSRGWPFRNVIEFHRAMAVFYKKHYSSGPFFAFNWLIYGAIWLKCAFELLRNMFRSDKYVGTKKP